MAYYRLHENWQLCGWLKLPFAVQNRTTGKALFFRKEAYEFLLSCDGMQDLHPEALSAPTQKAIEQLLENQVLSRVPAGHYAPLSAYKAYPTRYRQSVQWSITGHCNYRCKHCFMSAPEAKFPEPTFPKLLEVIRQLEECGVHEVSLTGGEPLVRKDFLQIVDTLLEHHMCIKVIYSNGKLITRELLEALRERNVSCAFQISFDGNREWNDWLRGVPGAYDCAVNAIQLCREYGHLVAVTMCIHKKNAHLIRESVNFLASLDVFRVAINRANPEGEWKNYPEYFLSTAEAFQYYLDYIPQFVADGCPVNLLLDGFWRYDKRAGTYSSVYAKHCPRDSLDQCFICGSTRTNFYISSEGVVLPCMSMAGTPVEKHFCSLFDVDLKEILNDSYFSWACEVTIKDLAEHNPNCAACDYLGTCGGGCRATATGDFSDDYLIPDQTTCEFFKGQWYNKLTSLCYTLFSKQ